MLTLLLTSKKIKNLHQLLRIIFRHIFALNYYKNPAFGYSYKKALKNMYIMFIEKFLSLIYTVCVIV